MVYPPRERGRDVQRSPSRVYPLRERGFEGLMDTFKVFDHQEKRFYRFNGDLQASSIHEGDKRLQHGKRERFLLRLYAILEYLVSSLGFAQCIFFPKIQRKSCL